MNPRRPSIIEAAKAYLRRGWTPVPFERGAKGPSGPSAVAWQLRKITEDKIPKLFSDDGNIGIQMGPKSNDLVDVDVDCKEALIIAPEFLPKTGAVFGRKSTPRAHYLYVVTDVPADVDPVIYHRDEKREVIIELRLGRTKGVQTMAPPSIHPDGELVEWDSDAEPLQVPYVEIARQVQLTAASSLLMRHWPTVSGKRHELALRVGGFLARAGLSAEEAEQVITAALLSLADDEIKDRKLAVAAAIENLGVGNVYGYPAMVEVLGEDVTETLATILDYSGAAEAGITALNNDYAFVTIGGNPRIMRFDVKTRFELLKLQTFTTWYLNKKKVQVGKKRVSIAEVWLQHPNRREYKGVEFSPPGSEVRQSYYNLWTGWAVEPKEGDCSLFLAHIKDNVCQGNEVLYRWVIGWFADIFQNPSNKPGTSLVLRGKSGVGKTITGIIIGSLIGDVHYELVDHPRYVTGQFNAHMASLLLLQADEAFWAGDKAGEGRLKGMTSGNRHRIEFKGIDAISVANHIHLMVTGNEDWQVPTSFRERRFAVIDVGEGKIQDRSYFKAIVDQMTSGGREALLYHLLTFDLSKVDVGVVPKTEALLEQKIFSLTPEQAWWLDVLKEGKLPFAVEERGRDGKPVVDKDDNRVMIPNSCWRVDLFNNYIAHAKEQGVSRRAIETRIGMFLKKMVGPNLTPHQANWKDRRERYFTFPPLKECREKFSQLVDQDVDWGEKWEGEEWLHPHLSKV